MEADILPDTSFDGPPVYDDGLADLPLPPCLQS